MYRQYGALVDYKDAQHAESNRLTIQTAQKHHYLQCAIILRLHFQVNLG